MTVKGEEGFYCQYCDKVSEIDFEHDDIIRLKCGHNVLRGTEIKK